MEKEERMTGVKLQVMLAEVPGHKNVAGLPRLGLSQARMKK